jgi:hypothetical protein
VGRLFARDGKPRRLPGAPAVERELHDVHRFASGAHPRAAFDGLDPDAPHLRVDFAMTVGAHAAARPVSQLLRAVHRARHPGRGEHALPHIRQSNRNPFNARSAAATGRSSRAYPMPRHSGSSATSVRSNAW